MKTHLAKTETNTKQSAANAIQQQQNPEKATFQLEDNRSQTPLEETIKNSVNSEIHQLARDRNKGSGKRPRRKDFKNERRRRGRMKQSGDFVGDLSQDATHDTQQEVHDWHQKRAKGRKAAYRKKQASKVKPVERDDNELNIKKIPSDLVTAYRVEVNKFNEKFTHMNVYKTGKNNTPTGFNYTPKSSKAEYVGKGKKTPPKSHDKRKYIDKFIKGRDDQPMGTMGWINFGEPERALEFYNQKSNNPNERALGNTFSIKSFQVPREVHEKILRDTVHERDKKKFPNRPINVDRETPNQFGLPQHYMELLNHEMVPGSAKEWDPEEFRKLHGARLKEIQKERKKHKKDHSKKSKAPNKYWHSKKNKSIQQEIHDQLHVDTHSDSESDSED
jgi:hypothetical protein